MDQQSPSLNRLLSGVECTTKEKESTVPQPEEVAEPTIWTLYVDGLSKKSGTWAGQGGWHKEGQI